MHRFEMSVADFQPISYPLSERGEGCLWRRLRLALIAGWRAGELDRQLAAGTNPAAGTPLAVRGERLTSWRVRARVAGGLSRAVRDAEGRTHGFSAAVRPDRREVLAARTVLATLASRLRGAEPVSAQGVALLQLLLTDGTSPLYRCTERGALGSQLRAAAAALEPCGRSARVTVGQQVLG